jgi:radical SAM-linked protein
MPRTAKKGGLQAGPAAQFHEEEPTTYRFRLSKTGPARYWGHLEMISQLVRAFKRAGVGLAFSQGFHPQPKLKLASALPLGVESMVEELEVSVTTGFSADNICAQVNPALPPGLMIADGRLRRPGEKLGEPDEVSYLITTPEPLDPAAIQSFEKADELEYIRVSPKGSRAIDMKQNIKELRLADDGLRLTVGRKGGRPKPEEVLMAVFGLAPEQAALARALKVGLKRY